MTVLVAIAAVHLVCAAIVVLLAIHAPVAHEDREQGFVETRSSDPAA